MIRKMIGSLDLRETGEVLDALEWRLSDALLGKNGEKDYDLCLHYCHKYLRQAQKELKQHYELSLMNKLVLGSDDWDKINLMSGIGGIKYIRELYPDCSLREAKDRLDLWKELGK
jgi:hypothetical protein